MQDSIVKEVVIKAPRARVWRTISDKTEFGNWFGVNYSGGTFVPGETVSGNITYPSYEHLIMDIDVVDVEPEKRLSYRWHPNATDPNYDYSSEPKTLVVFTLEEADGGTKLRIVESGFDAIPLHRRAEAFKSNDGGWAEQTERIGRYVSESK
jgi:uncharacterized protein YndB with AHSA1/START domain